MSYALQIGLRYLRSKKRSTVSVITFVAVMGVALGVGALLSVLSITSGFQDEFRNKVLGVNAHVLVLKYGLDFGEYRDVVARARKMPEVKGAAPFLINEMMLAKGDRLAGVLVKGVDPQLMPTVLDLPHHIKRGGMEGLRRPGATPPPRPDDVHADPSDEGDLDAFLENLAEDAVKPSEQAPEAARKEAAAAPVSGSSVRVPTPAEVEASLAAGEGASHLPDDDAENEILSGDLAGSEESNTGPTAALPGLVVGVTLAENLGLHVGDRVKVISPLAGLDTSLWAPGGGTPRARDFRVIGVFEAGFQEYDTRLVYVDIYEAQAFFDQGDTVTGVEISLHDLQNAKSVSRALERSLGAGPYHTLDWRELNHNLFTALEIQKVMLSLVIATIIFVAAFNVIATLIMMVLEKRREVAILKAMGARDGSVLGIFFVQGALIGVVGTLLGLVLGGAVCWYLNTYQFPLDPKVYLINHLPVRTSVTEFLMTIAIALGISATATLIPSWWAARLLPADGVRPH